MFWFYCLLGPEIPEELAHGTHSLAPSSWESHPGTGGESGGAAAGGSSSWSLKLEEPPAGALGSCRDTGQWLSDVVFPQAEAGGM